MITTDINTDTGTVNVTSEDDNCGPQVFTIKPSDDFVEFIADGRHHLISREALAELATQFNTILGI